MDVRLTSEQQQLRDAAAKLADDLGPGSVADLDDEEPHRAAGEGGRRHGLSDAALRRRVRCRGGHRRRGVRARAGRRAVPRTGARRRPAAGAACRRPRGPDEPDIRRPDEKPCRSGRIAARSSASSPRTTPAAGARSRSPSPVPTSSAPRAARMRWPASTPRSASSTARPSGPIRRSATCWPRAWPSSRARSACCATPRGRSTNYRAAEAIEAARVAKIYCARAALTVCETSIQVHGGIGNTWECLAHVYLRRVLAATERGP